MSDAARALRVKLFMDGANIDDMRAAYEDGTVGGFTTNPTLMRKAGITDYEGFAREAIEAIPDLPLSFEVFSDDFDEMEREARKIASWGGFTYIKIPVSNTRGEPATNLIEKLSGDGLRLNVTALMTLSQVRAVASALDPATPSIVSVFAGRIADTGADPVPVMTQSVTALERLPKAELLWASPREVLNVYQADQCGCDIITATPDVLAKLALAGKSLDDFSVETVQMFHRDAIAAGYKLV